MLDVITPTHGNFSILNPMKNKIIYDYVFIGSSPLSLIHALKGIDEDSKVLIISKKNQVGGCWSWQKQGGLEYECAAHLIEAIPGVYELLQEVSGVKFINALAQPERQFCGIINFKLRYFSKYFLLGALAKILVELISSLILRRQEEFFNSKIKLKHWINVNFVQLFMNLPKVKIPESGYVNFIKGLIKSCKEKGMNFQNAYVNECIDAGGNWFLTGSNGEEFIGKHLVLSSSVAMTETSSKDKLIAGNEHLKNRLSVILEVEDQYKLRPFSYVSLFNHKYIHRVVDVTDKLKSPKGVGHYLFELSMTKEDLQKLSFEDVCEIASSSRLFKKKTYAHLRFSSNFEYSIITNNIKSRERLTILDSFGNLAVGVKAWIGS